MRIKDRYDIKEKLGAGSFGVVYRGIDLKTGKEVAIKLEPAGGPIPQLQHEYKVYSALLGSSLAPRVYKYISEYELTHKQFYNVLVMQCIGPSLEALFTQCKRRFSVKTVIQLAIQMIAIIEDLHKHNIIHRDLKPDNFLFDPVTKRLYLVDYGLTKRYRDPMTHCHIAYRENKRLTGTPRYASINCHLGIEQSRRDDLESLDYIFMYFLRGSLPWQGLQARTKKQKYQKIMDRKMATPVELLHQHYPTEFKTFAEYVRMLRFADKPDYAYLGRMFKELAQRLQIQLDGVYDWDYVEAVPVVSVVLDPVAPPPTIAQNENASIQNSHHPTEADQNVPL